MTHPTFPALRWSWPWSQSVDQPQDYLEQFLGHRALGQSQVSPPVRSHFSTNFIRSKARRCREPRDTARSTSQDAGVPIAQNCRLYLISPERLEHPAIFADKLRAALDGGDVAAFQLRLEGVGYAAIA